MPKVTEEHRQARREQIIEAAINCFARNGFHQTSMKDICKEAGLSPGAVYLQFSSKEDIIEASYKRDQETRAARLEAARQTGPTRQAMDELWDSFARRLAQPDSFQAWQLWVQLLAEALRNPRIRESIRGNWDEVEKQLAELSRNATERGEINCDIDYNVAARVMIAVHNGLILQKIIDPKQDVQEYIEAFKTLLANYKKVTFDKENERRLDDD